MKILAHGIDLVDFGRIRGIYERHGQKFLDHIFTETEQQHALSVKNTIEKLSGRFAAKEAVLKLIGTGLRGKISWRDIEVTNTAMGEPKVNLSGEVERIATKKNIEQVTISITHTADFAIASAVALCEIDKQE